MFGQWHLIVMGSSKVTKNHKIGNPLPFQNILKNPRIHSDLNISPPGPPMPTQKYVILKHTWLLGDGT